MSRRLATHLSLPLGKIKRGDNGAGVFGGGPLMCLASDGALSVVRHRAASIEPEFKTLPSF